MELNLLPILNYEGKKLTISEKLEPELSKADSFSLLSPVCFDGCAVNIGGTIELSGKCVASLRLICDRCAESFDKVIEFDILERLKKEDEFSKSDEDDPDFLMFEGSTVSLDEIIYTNLYMNLPSKQLCSDECMGICPVCGKNLNHGSCDCKMETTDPRFDILDKLL